MISLEDISFNDIKLYESMFCDDDHMKDLGGSQPKEKIPEILQKQINCNEMKNGIVKKIIINNESIGTICVWENKYKDENISEFGWGIAKAYKGIGYGTKAVVAMIDHCRSTADPRWKFIHAFTKITNVPSNSICKRLGFKLIEEVEIDYDGSKLLSYHWLIDISVPIGVDITFGSLSGLWQRIEIIEPLTTKTSGSNDEQEKKVLWLQSSSGFFIDLRVNERKQREFGFKPKDIKSFSGYITYQKENSLLTWHRELDFRPLSPPDIGKIRFLTENRLEEDGVLPGDDYREIWERFPINYFKTMDETVIRLTPTEKCNRTGYLIIVGDNFGMSISRKSDNSSLEQNLVSFFSSEIENETENENEISNYISDFISVIGTTSTWNIDYSLHQELINCSILPGKYLDDNKERVGVDIHNVKCLLKELKWEIVEGKVPEAFELYFS